MSKKQKSLAVLASVFLMLFTIAPVSNAMHIMEGFLPVKYCILWGVICVPFLVIGFMNIKKVLGNDRRTLTVLALTGAFVFVLSSLKIPSVTGSCSHMTGTGLGAILFGPCVTSILGIIVLIFQAILLAHGGLTTLGANCFSMAIAGPIISWVLYKLLQKANVNKMVQTVYGNIKVQNPNLLFGISPAGNVEYCESLGADVKTWMKGPGYVDYIAPQIYWSNSYRVGKKTVRMFDNRFAKWKRLNKGNIPMYIGLALYQGGMKDASDRGWRKSKKIIASQISKIRRSEKAYGYILFSYESLYKKACRYEVKNMLARIARIKVTKVNTDGTTRLKTTVWPARLGQTVTWKSSNPSIASITNKGRIRVKQNGIVKFTVKKAGKSVSVKINTEDL